jgi:hypothetical protein
MCLELCYSDGGFSTCVDCGRVICYDARDAGGEGVRQAVVTAAGVCCGSCGLMRAVADLGAEDDDALACR